MSEEKLYTKEEVERACLRNIETKRTTVGDIVCNRHFDTNCNYEIYRGVHNDGGEKLWDTCKEGDLYADDPLSTENVSYITVDINSGKLIIEVL